MIHTAEEATSILEKYFPKVQFDQLEKIDKDYDGYHIEKEPGIIDMLEKCKEGNKGNYYLNISKMAKKEPFKALFPLEDIFKKYEKELQNKLSSCERLNIIKYFITSEKEDEKFAKGLNDNLDIEFHITKEALLNDFFGKSIYCCYPYRADNKESSTNKYWDFSAFNYQHDGNSVYKVFRYYTHKNCTLYLFGVDFTMFRNHRDQWPKIEGENGQTLPEYFNEFRNTEQFFQICGSDFLWTSESKQGEKWWDEKESKRHLLSKFGLNINLNLFFKDIYYSFCIPFLSNNDCLRMTNDERFIHYRELGLDTIKETLLREPYIANERIPIIHEQTDRWENKIHNILESTYETSSSSNTRTKKKNYTGERINGKRIKEDGSFLKRIKREIYLPTMLEEFMGQAAGQQGIIERNIFKKISHIRQKKEREKTLTLRKESRNDVSRLFKSEFRKEDEKKWLRWIQEVELKFLARDLQAYLPNTHGRRPESLLFRNYCKAMGFMFENMEDRQKKHRPFAVKIKSIVFELEKMGHWVVREV